MGTTSWHSYGLPAGVAVALGAVWALAGDAVPCWLLPAFIAGGWAASANHVQRRDARRSEERARADAVRSLQFDDIVRQLTEHARRRLAGLEGIARQLDAASVRLHALPGADVRAYVGTLGELSQGLRVAAAAVTESGHPVAQRSMRSGDIELF